MMPTEIAGLLRSTITITWDDGHVTALPARAVRLSCRCANCIEEMSGRPLLDPATVPDAVRARGINLVGQYAIQVDWSDNHSTGIFAFDTLRKMCRCAVCAPVPPTDASPAS